MKRLFWLSVMLFLMISKITIAQNKTFECDGIYPTIKNGWKLNLASDSTKTFFVDSIPIICFTELKSAHLTKSPYEKKTLLSIEMNDYAKIKFDSATMQNVGRPLLIIIENSIVSAPMVLMNISDGKVDIDGLDEVLIKRITDKIKK